jgi:hypothetical protein
MGTGAVSASRYPGPGAAETGFGDVFTRTGTRRPGPGWAFGKGFGAARPVGKGFGNTPPSRATPRRIAATFYLSALATHSGAQLPAAA